MAMTREEVITFAVMNVTIYLMVTFMIQMSSIGLRPTTSEVNMALLNVMSAGTYTTLKQAADDTKAMQTTLSRTDAIILNLIEAALNIGAMLSIFFVVAVSAFLGPALIGGQLMGLLGFNPIAATFIGIFVVYAQILIIKKYVAFFLPGRM